MEEYMEWEEFQKELENCLPDGEWFDDRDQDRICQLDDTIWYGLSGFLKNEKPHLKAVVVIKRYPVFVVYRDNEYPMSECNKAIEVALSKAKLLQKQKQELDIIFGKIR
jgi:hypothetical protein